MADNIAVTEGSGKTVATDEVGGIQFQKIKIDVGADGVSAPLSATDSLPATIYSGGVEVDFTAPVEVIGTGSAGAPASAVVTVQGITSGTNIPVSQATAANLNATIVGNVASAAADSGNPVKIGGKYNSAGLAVLTDGQRGDLQLSDRGYLKVVLANPTSGTGLVNVGTPTDATSLGNAFLFAQSVPLLYNGSSADRARSIVASFGTATGVQAVEQAGASFQHISANQAVTNVKASAGILHKVVINTKGASANVLSLYDTATTTTGSPIAVIDTTDATRNFVYDLAFANGLAAGLATGTAADITLVWR